MKRILICIILCLCTLIGVQAARKAPGEKVGVTFDTMAYDFGTINQADEKVTHEFVTTVTGESPVAILSASASCGCTKPSYDRKPAKPTKSTKIKVSFYPKGQKGEINKSVRLRLKNGDGKSEDITLRIVGVVVP